MRNMIRADLRRSLKKISFYVWFGVIFIFTFMFSGLADYADDTFKTQNMVLAGVLPILVSIPVFLSVYGDEMKSGSMQCIIGRGISRSKVILAKFLDCMILTGLYFIMIELVLYWRNIVFDVGYTQTQTLTIAFLVFIIYIRTIGYLAFSSFFVFFSWSTAPGVIVLITFSVILKTTLKTVQAMFHIPVYTYTFDGLLDSGFAVASAGNFAYQFIPAIVLIIGALILTMVVFRKKEIEF